MGSKKQLLVQSLKRAAALASLLGVIGGISASSASAQTARYQTAQYQPLNQQSQQAVQGMRIEGGLAPPPPLYSPAPNRNSARILGAQRAAIPGSTQQATVNRRALISRGRMISAGFPQEQGGLGTEPQDRNPSVLQRDDTQQPNIFGDNQSIPPVPQNDTPQVPVPANPNTQRPQDGELPPDIFSNPFDKERRPDRGQPTVEIPGQAVPDLPEDPPENGNEFLDDPNAQLDPNPFKPEETVPDDQIDYQPRRGFSTPPSKSNVYSPPRSSDLIEQQENGVYFVPAYDPIPGTQQPSLAPPAMMHPQYDPAWQGQYAVPNQPHYSQPQYQQSPYQTPYGHPQYQQLPQQNQYGQPQYQQPPANDAYPPNYAPSPGTPPEQQVYTPVVQPPSNLAYCKGPMTTARRGLMGKLTRDLKKDLGFGDYQSCQDAGSCGGCASDCNSTCPVFYFGFLGAYNNAFDVSNDQGSELLLDDGTAFYFSLGRMNGRNLRTEVELSFRSNDIRSLLTAAGELPASGQLQTFSGMANAYWEFVNFPTGRFKPYIGGGVGFLSATTDIGFASDLTQTPNQSDSSSSFAYQYMAGINFKVSNHLDFYGEYRFVEANSFGIASDRDDLSGDFRYKANSVGGGLRWKF